MEKGGENFMAKLEGTNVCEKDGTDTIHRGMYGEQQESVPCVHGYRIVVRPPKREEIKSRVQKGRKSVRIR